MQTTLEKAIEAVTQEQASISGSGRTDAGAHALRQVISFSTSSELSLEVLRSAVNAHLPADIAVTSVEEAERAFHPRHDATRRIYRYLIWNRPVRSPFWTGRAAHLKYPLDDESMNEAAGYLVGEHDFSAFVPTNFAGGRTRLLFRAECRRDGDLITVELEGTGFMRQMVRSIVGTLVEVGCHRMAPLDLAGILKSRDRALAGKTMPAAGLYLIDVHYPDETRIDGPTDRTDTEGVVRRRSGECQEHA